MSKFFVAGSSSSESDDSDVEDVPQVLRTRPTAQVSRFMPMSDDEDDVKRTVRSQKDKRYDELQTSIRQMRNSMKIRDIAKVMTEWENLCKAKVKAKAVIEKDGIPNFFIKALGDLEDFVQQQWEDKESRQKLSKVNARALASLRQKLRKYNRDFEESINDYKQNPDKYKEEEEAEERDESGSESEDEVVGKKKVSFLKATTDAEPKAKEPVFDDMMDFDSDDMFASDESDESSSDDDLPTGGVKKLTADMFLKTEKSEAKVARKLRPDKSEKAEKKPVVADNEGWTEVKASSHEKSRQLFPKDTEINHQAILKKLQEILAARGKKSTDRPYQVGFFKELRKISEKHNLGPALSLKISFSIMAAIYDSAPSTDTALKPDMWSCALEEMQVILVLLEQNQNIQVGDIIAEDSENVDTLDEPLRVRGCPYTILERLYSEFIKILQNTDCHSTEYVDRLRDESLLSQLILRMQAYLESNSNAELISKAYLLRIEHIYYKLDTKGLKNIRDQIERSENASKRGADNKEEEKKVEEEKVEKVAEEEEESKKSEEKEESDAEDNSAVIDKLCKFIYTKASDRVRTRAMLCHIYHHALHDRLFEARDLMLISHLQETIQHSDISTQILYNRTMVQLGLCAFRHGMIRDAHNALLDIQSTGRAKELLAQGLMNIKNVERTPEQEKIEKRRLLPFHMHINLELLECVYLTSAMLLEVPYMAAREFDNRRRIISKSFHHQLRLSERQPLVGPPETMREHVVAAAKAMKTGDWVKCSTYILAVKCWNLFSQSSNVKEMLKRKIQEESLRTYMFTYNKVYDSISMHSLAEKFSLPPASVHSIISKMIISEELQASWDEPTQTLILDHGAEPSLLQSLTLQLADKIGSLVEHHERIVDFKQGFYDKGRQGRFRHQRPAAN
eukprot:gene14237-15722_t